MGNIFMGAQSFMIFGLIGAVFGVFAMLMTYLITYNEYAHHYTTKKEPRRMATQAGIFAFVFFFVLSLLIGFVLSAGHL